MADLGLRYRPSAQADLEEHAASLALLACDLADLPPQHLDRAIRQWAVKSHFMPKASDLVALCQSYVARPTSPGAKVDLVTRYNADLRAKGNFSIEWFEDEAGDMKLRPRT